jgi:hypothetical protein
MLFVNGIRLTGRTGRVGSSLSVRTSTREGRPAMAQTKTGSGTKTGKRLVKVPKKLRKKVNKMLKRGKKGKKK